MVAKTDGFDCDAAMETEKAIIQTHQPSKVV